MTSIPRPLAFAGVVLVAIGVYWNSLDNGFVWDDHVQIESNAFLSSAQNARQVLSPAFFARVLPVRGGGRPLVLLSLLADRALWGFEPGGYHLTNVLLHAAASAAMLALALELMPALPALIAALLFATHPVHTETIDVVSFRGDLLAAWFVFLGLWGYIRLSSEKRRFALIAAIAALGTCYFAGLMAKEMALPLPGLALLYEWTYRRPGSRKQFRAFGWRNAWIALPPAALAAWYLCFRAPRAGFPPALASGLLPSSPQWDVLYRDPAANFRTMSWVFGQYFALMAIPFPLEIDRAPLIVQRWLDPWVLLSWLVLGLLLWIAVRCARGARRPAIAFGIGWCFLTLIPVSNLVPIYNVMAERYLYLVSAGACLALAAFFDALPWPTAGLSVAAACVAIFAGATVARNRDYRDDRTLFFRSTPRMIESARLHCNRGEILQREGNFTDAAREYAVALAIHPNYVEAKVALGTTFDELGLHDEALRSYREGVALKPRYAIPYFLLAEALRREHKLDEARSNYADALRMDPRFAMAHVGMGLALAEGRRVDEAIDELRRAQESQPNLAVAHYALANLLADQKRWPEAIGEFKRTLALEPGGPDIAGRLAYCYRRMGRSDLAKRWMERARLGG